MERNTWIIGKKRLLAKKKCVLSAASISNYTWKLGKYVRREVVDRTRKARGWQNKETIMTVAQALALNCRWYTSYPYCFDKSRESVNHHNLFSFPGGELCSPLTAPCPQGNRTSFMCISDTNKMKQFRKAYYTTFAWTCFLCKHYIILHEL